MLYLFFVSFYLMYSYNNLCYSIFVLIIEEVVSFKIDIRGVIKIFVIFYFWYILCCMIVIIIED